MKKLFQCPDCGSIFLKDTQLNQCFWQELNCFELTALEVILESEPLQAITGTITVINTSLCDVCHKKMNPTPCKN